MLCTSIRCGGHDDDNEEINKGIQLYNDIHPKVDTVDISFWLKPTII